MKEIQIFVLHNEKDVLNKITNSNFIKKINLNNLDLSKKYKDNSLAENRFFIYLSNNTSLLPDCNYIGICSASWNSKYKTNEGNSDTVKLENISELACKFKKSFIYVPALVENWYDESISNHVGMEVYIDELLKRNKFKKTGFSFYSNNFICKKSILIEFLRWWRKDFNYFFEKYGYEYEYDSEECPNYKPHVNCSYFYERLTISYFANKNYNILNLDPKVIFLNNVSKKNEYDKKNRDKMISSFNKKLKFFN